MKLAGIYDESMSNGEGWRGVVFVSGCPHNCEGCHNKKAQDFHYGEDYDLDTLVARFKESSILRGITVSGGEPLCPENIVEVLAFIGKMKAARPDFDIWCYTGYTFEDLEKSSPYFKDIVELVDVLVDGPYIKDLYKPDLKFRGSSNQRIIRLNKLP